MFFKNLVAPNSIATDRQSHIDLTDPNQGYDFGMALEDAEAAFAPFRDSPKKHDLIRRPIWLDKDDPLSDLLNRQRNLLQTGKIIYAGLTIANTLLFEPGRDNCPGKMIYSFDKRFIDSPRLLGDFASGLFEYRGRKDLNEVTLQALADLLADDYGRTLHAPLPKLYCDGATVALSSVLFERRHLVNGVLHPQVLPVLASPWEQGIMVLPARFWPASFCEAMQRHLNEAVEIESFG
ncbi:hypothetical protein GCM10011309_22140 [Litorimonas cladophorae]|uniref:Uncharacterized protein n=1 Tax=Litorimonas cladophorae TaxID=1220491 RepID=A0A918KPH5_9PROT|nr:hypothetical protein [Litorimonas cladophorae]GGX71506.1 hypothetical protein GCM10011309_22140 [Litorimonas cladophorae]